MSRWPRHALQYRAVGDSHMIGEHQHRIMIYSGSAVMIYDCTGAAIILQ